MNWKDAWQIVKGFWPGVAQRALHEEVMRDFRAQIEAANARSAANRKVYREMQRKAGVP